MTSEASADTRAAGAARGGGIGPAIDRRLLRDDVFGRLRDAIVDGTFATGEQLRDQDLADRLGVSRTPVREALLRLADAGLVVTQPGRSTTVSTLDECALRDARDVVAGMHEVALREAVSGLTAADLEAMREANRRFRSAIERGDVEGPYARATSCTACPWPRCERGAHSGARAVHAGAAPARSGFASPPSKGSLARAAR